MTDRPVYMMTINLEPEMTGERIAYAIFQAARDEFAQDYTVQRNSKTEKWLRIGANIGHQPYGLEIWADEMGTLMTNDGLYTKIFVVSNDGWSKDIFQEIIHPEDAKSFYKDMTIRFESSLRTEQQYQKLRT